MRRYWVEDIVEVNTPLALSGDLFKHIHIVCRQDINAEFEILSSKVKGFLFLARVKDIHKNTMVVDILSKRAIPLIPKPHIHLALSLPKIKTLEDVVEKMVELGVFSLYPFYSEFSFFKSKDRVEEKSSRLRKIVISACEQSARAEELVIHRTQSFDQVLDAYINQNKTKSVHGMSFYEGEAQGLRSYLDQLQNISEFHDNIQDLWVFVGSEGGFSLTEIEKFKKAGIPSLSLGEQVLRVETACVSIVSVLKYYFRMY